jgi:enoyl-CoA hydratase/carnithine racemase
MFEDIEYEVQEGIATVKLVRPDVRNALQTQTLVELVKALDRADTDNNVYAVIVTGAGSAFCAGADRSFLPEWRDGDYETYEEELGRFQTVIDCLRSMGTPSIAAVNGPAVGAGCDIALACDIRVVGSDGSFIEGFVHVGLLSGDGGAWLLPRLVGEAKAKEHLLTGEPISASEAVKFGLAAVKSDEPVLRAREYAHRLRDLSATAVQRTKQLATMRPESLEEHQVRATAAQWACIQDDEFEIVVNSLRDDREPDFDRP